MQAAFVQLWMSGIRPAWALLTACCLCELPGDGTRIAAPWERQAPGRDDTMQTLFFKGLVELGIEVKPEDWVPKRQRRAR